LQKFYSARTELMYFHWRIFTDCFFILCSTL